MLLYVKRGYILLLYCSLHKETMYVCVHRHLCVYLMCEKPWCVNTVHCPPHHAMHPLYSHMSPTEHVRGLNYIMT